LYVYEKDVNEASESYHGTQNDFGLEKPAIPHTRLGCVLYAEIAEKPSHEENKGWERLNPKLEHHPLCVVGPRTVK